MLDKICMVQFYVILTSIENVVADISIDYYFGDNLRTNPLLACSSQDFKKSCEDKCGPDHACLLGSCFCITNDDTSVEGSEELRLEPLDMDFMDLEDNTDVTSTRRPLSPMEYLQPKPALRHHIAHFCPNLDVAQECIRTCIKVGKPAFCGKDHVCYCGHKYDYPVDEKNLKPAEAYAEFQDMYEKYFGPKSNAAKTSKSKLVKQKGRNEKYLVIPSTSEEM